MVTALVGRTPASKALPVLFNNQCFTFSDMAGELDRHKNEVWVLQLWGRGRKQALAPLLYLDRSDIRIGNNWKAAEHKTLERCGLRPSHAETGPDTRPCAIGTKRRAHKSSHV